MLILTRRIGEAVNIGDDIIVTVLGVKGNQTRLGIAAPKTTSVDREEVRLRKSAEPYVKLCAFTSCVAEHEGPSNYCSMHRAQLDRGLSSGRR